METEVLLGLLAFSAAIIAGLLGLVAVLLRRNGGLRAVTGGSNSSELRVALERIEGSLAAGFADLRGDLRVLKTLMEEMLRKDGTG